MFKDRKLLKEIKEEYKNLNEDEIKSELKDVRKGIADLYSKDIEKFKSNGYKLIVYAVKNRSMITYALDDLNYKYVIMKDRVFVVLDENNDFDTAITNFIKARFKVNLFSTIAMLFCFLTICVFIYGFNTDNTSSASTLAVCVSLISLSFTLMSNLCLKQSNNYLK